LQKLFWIEGREQSRFGLTNCVPSPIPPPERKNSTDRIRRYIHRISRRVSDKVRPDDLEEQAPNNQVEENFQPLRRSVVLTQAKASLQPEDRRQSARDQ